MAARYIHRVIFFHMLFGTQTMHVCILAKQTHTHIGHVDSAGSHVESEVKSDSCKLMGIPDIVGNDTISVSLLYLVAKLGIFVH